MVGPFRVFRTHVRRAFEEYRGVYVNIDVLLTWGTTRFAAVRLRHDVRPIGESNYGLRTLLTHTMNMMTRFGTLPQPMASPLGFSLTLLGGIPLAIVIGRFLMHGVAVPALVESARRWCAEQGADRVTVVTQARNAAGLRLYQRAGMTGRLIQLWFHKWW